MYTRRNYGFWMTFRWSYKPFLYGLIYSSIIGGLVFLVNWQWGFSPSLPWQPISVLGIAVAFYLGFKNNASYDRTWEARKIWGGIVNASRSYGAGINSFVKGPDAPAVKREMLYRHIAWLTALRYQLRLSREWEHTQDRINGLYNPEICEAYYDKLDQEMMGLIPKEEFQLYKSKANMATQILDKQAQRLQELHDGGYFDDFRHMELFGLIRQFYDEQGRSERIKNFPFPRQYASVALWMTFIFSILAPFGMLNVFLELSPIYFWGFIPFSALVIWVFFLMEKIGDYSENPFEGTYNDVPITSISRGIEIDLRQMLNETEVPPAIPNVNGFLM